MIAKVIRGRDVGNLVRYLYGPGKHNEHTEQHLVAAWDPDVRSLEPEVVNGRHDVRQLVEDLELPVKAAGMSADDRPVYHVVVSAAKANERTGEPADRVLSDREWRGVVEDLMTRTGIAPAGCRWIAVRHDPQHVHVVATLASESGQRFHPRHDYYQLGAGCRDAEVRLGLRRTPPRDSTSVPPPTRAETERAQRHRREPDRVTLRREVRAAAVGSRSEAEFLERLRGRGVVVKLRQSQIDGQVTGLAFGLPGRGVAFGGSKLAPDLSLPALRARWSGAADLTPGDLARAVVGRRANSPLEVAVQDLDRASREPGGRLPARGTGVRAPSLLLAAAHVLPDQNTRHLVASLALLAEAVARHRAMQGRHHQAQAAERAATQLRAHHAAQAARLAPAAALAQDAPHTAVRAAKAMRGIRR